MPVYLACHIVDYRDVTMLAVIRGTSLSVVKLSSSVPTVNVGMLLY